MVRMVSTALSMIPLAFAFKNGGRQGSVTEKDADCDAVGAGGTRQRENLKTALALLDSERNGPEEHLGGSAL